MKKVLLFLLALNGLPLVWGLFWTLMTDLALGVTSEAWFAPKPVGFISGALVMCALYTWCRKRFTTLYVFAHEMTHALVGLCCFAKIHEFKIGEGGGHVVLSKSNLLITLSPYCIPFYLLLCTFLHALLNRFVPDLLPAPLWSAIFGFMTLFHILFTIDTLISVSQPDTHVYGRFFSYWLILCTNLFFALLALCLTKTITWNELFAALLHHTTQAYAVTLNTISNLLSSFL